MSSAVGANSDPIESREQLLAYFRAGEKTEEARGIGTEHEKFVFRRDDLSMISHAGDGGLQDLFERLVAAFDWKPLREAGRIIGLEHPDRRVTLEPGGQFELSGAITQTIGETEEELDQHFDQLRSVAEEDFYFTCWGMNPFYRPDQVPLVPKQRYDIMRSYLPTRGELSPWMMKTSCTIQANYDYVSEQDAAELVRSALLVSPIVSALFANSPYRGGADTGMQSFRGFAWTRTDPDRTGWPEFMYRDDWGYGDYLDYILDIPMFFVEREGRLIPMIGKTFREYIHDGHGVYEPTVGDFELHLSTAFPEIRMKQFVEVRGADGGPRSHMLALPALWKGLLYHVPSRRRAAGLVDDLSVEEHEQLFMEVYDDGLDAVTPVGRVGELASELIDIATEGLVALADKYDHASEAPYLAPLASIVESGTTLADELREDFRRLDGDRRKIIEKWSLLD